MEKEPLILTVARSVFYSLIQLSVIPEEENRDDVCLIHYYNIFPVLSILGSCTVGSL